MVPLPTPGAQADEVRALAERVRANPNAQAALDDLVYDFCGETPAWRSNQVTDGHEVIIEAGEGAAARINNEGPEAQIWHLLGELGDGANPAPALKLIEKSLEK